MSVRELRTELETLQARGRAIIEEFGAGGLTAEKDQELAGIATKATELAGQLRAEKALDERKADMAKLDEFLNAPQYRVAHGVGENDDDTTKSLRSAGWELKSGTWHAPTSLGVMQPMYDDNVLHGDIPPEASESQVNFIKTTRRAMQPDYRAAYVKLFRQIGKFGEFGMAWSQLSGDEQKALSEGTDTAGGFLVPPDAQAEILVRLPQQAAVRSAGARVQQTSRDILRYPLVQPASATAGGLASGGGSIFSSGFVGTWAGETPAFTDTDPSFGSFEIAVKKLRVATKVSNDFLADSMVNVLSFLSSNGADNMALVEDNGFVNGDGAGLQPLGLLNSGATTVDVEGSTADTISNTTSNAGSAPKIIDVEYAVPSQYVGGATWMMRRSIEGKIRKLIDASGRFLWPGVLGSGFAMPAKEIDGYRVVNSEFIQADGTNANKVLVFGNWSYYIIAQRAQITSTILRERFADTDQTGIILWERVGGATWNTDAFRIGIV